jgi:hypothetical protein
MRKLAVLILLIVFPVITKSNRETTDTERLEMKLDTINRDLEAIKYLISTDEIP